MFTSILRSEKFRLIFVLLVLAFLIRLVFLVLLTTNHAVETGRDAQGYFNRAIGFELILRSILSGHLPSTGDLARAYTSNWPPVQSFVLGVGFLIFGHSLLAGRLIMVILSALTTPLVYLVTEKISNRRSAWLASLLFAIYPSFVHFSFRLFSETTFIFLFFLMFLALVPLAQIKHARQALWLAAISGCLLAMATLARAIGLVWIPIVGLWTWLNSFQPRKNFVSAALLLVAALVTLMPWELTLFGLEGRVILVTRTADLSLYLPNYFKPQTPILASQALAPNTLDSETPASKTQDKPSVHNFVSLPKPLQQWARTWNPDFTLYRYLLMLGYPPLNPILVAFIFWATFSAFVLFLIFAIWGLLVPTPPLQHRWLFVGIVAMTMLLYMFTHGQARYGIPLLAVLLPAAGHGMANIKTLFAKTNLRWSVVAAAGMMVMGVSTLIGLPHEYGTLGASSYYVSFVRGVDSIFQQKSTVSDRLLLRVVGNSPPQKLTLSIVGSDYAFADSGNRTMEWNPSPDHSQLDLAAQSRTAVQPVRLKVETDSMQSAMVDLTPTAWHTWQPTGVPGIEYLWLGSGAYREADLDSESTRY